MVRDFASNVISLNYAVERPLFGLSGTFPHHFFACKLARNQGAIFGLMGFGLSNLPWNKFPAYFQSLPKPTRVHARQLSYLLFRLNIR